MALSDWSGAVPGASVVSGALRRIEDVEASGTKMSAAVRSITDVLFNGSEDDAANVAVMLLDELLQSIAREEGAAKENAALKEALIELLTIIELRSKVDERWSLLRSRFESADGNRRAIADLLIGMASVALDPSNDRVPEGKEFTIKASAEGLDAYVTSVPHAAMLL